MSFLSPASRDTGSSPCSSFKSEHREHTRYHHSSRSTEYKVFCFGLWARGVFPATTLNRKHSIGSLSLPFKKVLVILLQDDLRTRNTAYVRDPGTGSKWLAVSIWCNPIQIYMLRFPKQYSCLSRILQPECKSLLMQLLLTSGISDPFCSTGSHFKGRVTWIQNGKYYTCWHRGLWMKGRKC